MPQRTEHLSCYTTGKASLSSDAVSAASVRRLQRGEALFKSGASRHTYRVACGAICHSFLRHPGTVQVIECAVGGDLVGLGRMDRHVTSAHAIVASEVEPVPDHVINLALESDDALAFRFAAATDLEFMAARQKAITATQGSTLARVAASIVALARLGEPEGRSPYFVSDELSGAAMAHLLRLQACEIRAALTELSRRNLICDTSDGLIINDISGLEQVGNGDLNYLTHEAMQTHCK